MTSTSKKTATFDVEKYQQQINKKVAASAEKFIDDLPRFLENKLGAAVAVMLGFTFDDWGNKEWKVDHCNGRISTVSTIIENKAKKDAAAAIDKVITKKVVENAVKNASKDLRVDFKLQLFRQLRKKVCELAEEVGNVLFCELRDDILKKIRCAETFATEEVKDLADPSVTDNMSPLKELLVKELFKTLQEEEEDDE